MADHDRIAVIDLGTNSTRLLVAEVSDGAVQSLERRSTVTRLGEGVDSSGRLSDEAMQRVLDVVEGYAKRADEHDVGARIAVATSATRDAENGPDLEQKIRDEHGFEIEIISGDEEARLTFMGATAARGGDEPTLVIDVGGGSTEFVVGAPRSEPGFHVSTNLGSVRQSERHLEHDPPTEEELDALAAAAREIIADGVPAEHRKEVAQGIAVAGTATQLASVELGLEPYDPEKVDGHVLTAEACERLLASLGALPLDERKQVGGMDPDRAPTIVAGATILLAAMEAFGLEQVEVTEADILHGAALSHAAG
jgi:exopolyphosphatase / guanosine-5'-triphosphate,3'-diphosphate pyrophosphatase